MLSPVTHHSHEIQLYTGMDCLVSVESCVGHAPSELRSHAVQTSQHSDLQSQHRQQSPYSIAPASATDDDDDDDDDDDICL